MSKEEIKIIYVASYRSDGETYVIGVADSSKKIEEMILEYFGEAEFYNKQNVREHGIEFTVQVKDEAHYASHGVVTVEYFTLSRL